MPSYRGQRWTSLPLWRTRASLARHHRAGQENTTVTCPSMNRSHCTSVRVFNAYYCSGNHFKPVKVKAALLWLAEIGFVPFTGYSGSRSISAVSSMIYGPDIDNSSN
jgi:hypothetical protein